MSEDSPNTFTFDKLLKGLGRAAEEEKARDASEPDDDLASSDPSDEADEESTERATEDTAEDPERDVYRVPTVPLEQKLNENTEVVEDAELIDLARSE